MIRDSREFGLMSLVMIGDVINSVQVEGVFAFTTDVTIDLVKELLPLGALVQPFNKEHLSSVRDMLGTTCYEVEIY